MPGGEPAGRAPVRGARTLLARGSSRGCPGSQRGTAAHFPLSATCHPPKSLCLHSRTPHSALHLVFYCHYMHRAAAVCEAHSLPNLGGL